MNPIEYKSPNRPSVWACGQCKRVCAGAVSCGPEKWTSDLAEMSQEQAERCCKCDKCGALINHELSSFYCDKHQAEYEAQLQSVVKEPNDLCPTCDGTGITEVNCSHCKGSGEPGGESCTISNG